jgi:hypothetical protein
VKSRSRKGTRKNRMDLDHRVIGDMVQRTVHKFRIRWGGGRSGTVDWVRSV